MPRSISESDFVKALSAAVISFSWMPMDSKYAPFSKHFNLRKRKNMTWRSSD
jgi:hypothetical protein